MNCRIIQKEIEEIRPTHILPQTTYWGRIKDGQGYIPAGFEITVSKDLLYDSKKSSENVHDDLLVLIKYIDSTYCFAYVPYGPKLEPSFENQGLLLEHISETIRPFLPVHCIFIRYDLIWQNQWAVEDEYFDQSGHWNGPPKSQVQELRVNYKTEHWNLRKSPGDILPKNTFILNLTLNEKELLKNMRYNTRYNIRKATKNNIEVKEFGIDHISDWYKLYLETAVRHQMPLQNERYFESILKNQDNSKNGVKVKMLMAQCEGEFLASMFLVLSHKRGNYLYGASSPNHQMASYALQWESIKVAKKWGCTEYDMFGSAPNLSNHHPLHGVHVYKKGFGGDLTHRMGCWDYPFLSNEYEHYKVAEMRNRQ